MNVTIKDAQTTETLYSNSSLLPDRFDPSCMLLNITLSRNITKLNIQANLADGTVVPLRLISRKRLALFFSLIEKDILKAQVYQHWVKLRIAYSPGITGPK